jgi:hypothetical protein
MHRNPFSSVINHSISDVPQDVRAGGHRQRRIDRVGEPHDGARKHQDHGEILLPENAGGGQTYGAKTLLIRKFNWITGYN